MRVRTVRLWRVACALALLTALVGACGGDDGGGDEDGDGSLSAGACVDATDGEDIKVVDCESADATAQVIGTYESGRCPSGSIGIDSTQFLDGRELEDGDLSQACAKDLEDITSADRAQIEEARNPTYHGLPKVGSASKFEDSPEPEAAECLEAAREVSGSSDPQLTPVSCDSDEAAWTVVELVDGDNGTYEGDDCPTDATAAASVWMSNPPKMLCITEIQ